MQSSPQPIIMSVASMSSGRGPSAVLPTSGLPGQLGPTPAIPTLKQLQDHHIKTKTSNNNNNNNYKAGVLAVPALKLTGSSLAPLPAPVPLPPSLPAPAALPAALPARTVPPVVLKLTADPGEQAAKRTYSVTSPQPPAEPSGTIKRMRLEEDSHTQGPAAEEASGCPPSSSPGFVVKKSSNPAGAAPLVLGMSAESAAPEQVPGVMLLDGPAHPSVLHYQAGGYLAGQSPGPPVALPPRPPSGPPATLPPRPPSGPPVGLPPRPPSGPAAAPPRPASTSSSMAAPPRVGSAGGPSGAPSRPHASPLRGKHKVIRQQALEENREGLLDCIKHVPETFQAVLRQHILLQLGRTQGQSIVASMHKAEMIASYQPWVILTYGDAAKTKTITLAKYARIVRTLRGEEVNSAENSKFRFWVRSKGFRLGAPEPEGYSHKPADDILGSYGVDTRSGHLYICADEMGMPTQPLDAPPLYVPTGTAKEDDGRSVPVYKRVAVVENFFDIIYSVHVDIEGRGNKHAGQKRTYRTITDSYAFLPREAVTRFLLGCTECNRRPRSPSSPSVAVKDDDSADSVAGTSSSSSVASQRSSPSPAASSAPSSTSVLSPSIVSNSHPHPPTEHSDFFKRITEPPRPVEESDQRPLLPYPFNVGDSSARTRYMPLHPSTATSTRDSPSPGSSPDQQVPNGRHTPHLGPHSSPHHAIHSTTHSPRSSPHPTTHSAAPTPYFTHPHTPHSTSHPAPHAPTPHFPFATSAFSPRAAAVDCPRSLRMLRSPGEPADDPRTTSPALAEALLLPLREDQSLFKLPVTYHKDERFSPHPIFLHSPTGKRTDVSLTPLSPKESSVSEKLANSPFSIQNISKSSRKSPTPDEDRISMSEGREALSESAILREKLERAHDNFAVPHPPKPKSPPKAPSPSTTTSSSSSSSKADDTFVVPKPPKPRNPPPILKQLPRSQSPVSDPLEYPLRPLEAVAPKPLVEEPAASVSYPSTSRAGPSAAPSAAPRPGASATPRQTSSIMAGYEPAAGSGLLNLLLKSGVLRNCGPRTTIPDAGEIDLNMPITTTYLKHMRSLGYTDQDALQIDVEMSLYQHVLGVPLKIVDDYL